MKRTVWIIALIIAGTVYSQQIEIDVLQAKLNRVYFSVGTEAGVQAGADVFIDCPGDTGYAGVIEYSGPGISYSAPIPALDYTGIDSSCTARITVAAIDSQATVIVGTDLPLANFDLEHEPLFVRTADTIIMSLIDSARVLGNSATLYLRQGIRFSDGTPLNAEELRSFFIDLNNTSRSYPVRYFFSKLLPIDSGGMNLVDGSTLRMEFYHPFPRACYFLSHPVFAVHNRNGCGTGAMIEIADPGGGIGVRAYRPNQYYRGDQPAISELVVKQYDQQYRMTFAFENGELDAVVGFGFESDLAGQYEARALYPETVAMIPGVARHLFSGGIFSTSLYYSFNPSLGHLYFQYGDIMPVYRWLPQSPDSAGSRYYPFDILKGKQLFSSVEPDIDSVRLAYDHALLYATGDYLADIAAREGMMATNQRFYPGIGCDIRVAFLPSSDEVMPFALFSAILELNDQNLALPPDTRMDRPGWDDAGRGSQMYDVKNRRTFFSRAEELLFSEAGFFPLFRPYIYSVPAPGVSGIDFDFYGYPILHAIRKLQSGGAVSPGGSER